MASAGLDEVIRSSEVIVRSGRYAYLKAGPPADRGEPVELGAHFLVARDADEITVVTEEANLGALDLADAVKWFRLIEIRVSQPFAAPGFIARVTRAIADRGLNVLAVSTFSKDYFLVREESTDTAVAALRDVGFPVSAEESP